ncbi:MAG TPA: hypothetical protein VF794_40840, partial [Archangium sp.]|uniref:hypothetical protein n=1 Tax=Archangium sp. TaxID=1872627 RepID=UPI002EDA6F78
MIKKQTAILGTLLATTLLGCGTEDRMVEGQSVDFHGGKVTTWATLDAEGVVKEVGFTLPYKSIESAPVSDGTHDHTSIFVADFPQVVRDTTFINHFEFDWMAAGHPPERHSTPHFDFHFYGVDKAATKAIDCTNAKQAPETDIPVGWVAPVPPDAPDATEFCVPNMGYHALPTSEFDENGVKNGVFDKAMLAGFYDAKFIFIEPMVTKAALQQKASFSLPVPQPKSVGRATLFPTT